MTARRPRAIHFRSRRCTDHWGDHARGRRRDRRMTRRRMEGEGEGRENACHTGSPATCRLPPCLCWTGFRFGGGGEGGGGCGGSVVAVPALRHTSCLLVSPFLGGGYGRTPLPVPFPPRRPPANTKHTQLHPRTSMELPSVPHTHTRTYTHALKLSYFPSHF